MYNMQLWETSGHAANYRENMFLFEVSVLFLVLKLLLPVMHLIWLVYAPKLFISLGLSNLLVMLLNDNHLIDFLIDCYSSNVT